MKRIAILKPSALGDVVHALPVLSALRAKYPAAHISWVVNRGYAGLLAGHPDLDDVVPFDRGAFRSLQAATYACHFSCELRRKRFDLVVDLQGLLRTGLMAASTGAPRKIGFAAAREGAARFYTDRVAVPDADRIHAVERYWRIAEYLGAGGGPKRFVVPISATEASAARELLGSLPRPWAAAVVGSRWATKCWPPGHYAALFSRMQQSAGGTVIFVGSGDDTALSRVAARGLPGPVLDLTGATSLPRLAAVLSTMDVVVGNDTGPLHLAAALGRRCVAPYTCTRGVLHGPFGVSAGVVETTVPCGGSYLKVCPHGMICMAELTPEKLWPPLAEVLAPWLSRSQSA